MVWPKAYLYGRRQQWTLCKEVTILEFSNPEALIVYPKGLFFGQNVLLYFFLHKIEIFPYRESIA